MARRTKTATRKAAAPKVTRGPEQPSSSSRYPQWRVDLFHAGIVERRSIGANEISARALRAPGA